jgi:hypothetical protein
VGTDVFKGMRPSHVGGPPLEFEAAPVRIKVRQAGSWEESIADYFT